MGKEFVIRVKSELLTAKLIQASITVALLTTVEVFAFFYFGISKLELLIVVLTLPFMVSSAYWLYYLLTVSKQVGAKIHFTEQGLEDTATTLSLGLVEMAELRKVKFSELLFFSRCLEIRLRKNAVSLSERGGNFLYRKILGDSTYIPLNIIDAKIDEIKSFIVTLRPPEAVIETPISVEKAAPPPVLEPTVVVEPKPTPVRKVYEIALPTDDQPGTSTSTVAASTLTMTKSIGSKDFFGQRIVDYYKECISNFPQWQQNALQNGKIPVQVSGISSSVTDKKEQVEFQFGGLHWCFAKQVEESEETAILVIAVNQSEVIRIRLQIEIGTFEYVCTVAESVGPWVEVLEDLLHGGQRSQPERKVL